MVLIFVEADGSRAAFAVQGSGNTGQFDEARRAIVLDSSTAEEHYWPVSMRPCESKASQDGHACMSLAPDEDCQSQRKRRTKCKVDSFWML